MKPVMSPTLGALASILASILAPILAMAGVLLSGPVAAQVSLTRTPAAAPTLGRAIGGASPTVFSISPTGVVTRVSGDAIRLSSASVTAPRLTIRCSSASGQSRCARSTMRVRVQPASGGGAASIIRLRVGDLQGTTFSGGQPAEAGVLTFDLNPIGEGGVASFSLGMDVRLEANAPGGQHDFDYLVTVDLL